jgi:hypothetical protein
VRLRLRLLLLRGCGARAAKARLKGLVAPPPRRFVGAPKASLLGNGLAQLRQAPQHVEGQVQAPLYSRVFRRRRFDRRRAHFRRRRLRRPTAAAATTASGSCT